MWYAFFFGKKVPVPQAPRFSRRDRESFQKRDVLKEMFEIHSAI